MLERTIIIDGTLSWQPLCEVYLDEFSFAGYEKLTVIDVEIPFSEALSRAKSRWWEGRLNGHPLGGRFIPEDVLLAYYPSIDDPVSICAENAKNLAEQAADELGDGLLIACGVDPSTGGIIRKSVTNFGSAP